MAFYSTFADFISWIFSFDVFRICFAVTGCFAGWWCMSELVRYLLRPFSGSGGEKNDN